MKTAIYFTSLLFSAIRTDTIEFNVISSNLKTLHSLFRYGEVELNLYVGDPFAFGADQVMMLLRVWVEMPFVRIDCNLSQHALLLERLKSVVYSRKGHGREFPGDLSVDVLGSGMLSISIQI